MEFNVHFSKSLSELHCVSESESVSVPGSEWRKFWGTGPHPPARTGHRFQTA